MPTTLKHVLITGAGGFLGTAIEKAARRRGIDVTCIRSGRRGGIDLAHPAAVEQLMSSIDVREPGETCLIHAAAVIEWDTSRAFLDNAAMGVNVAMWAKQVGVRFSILVSSVSVFPACEQAGPGTTPCPQNLYGLGKLAAEESWRLLLPESRFAVVRLAGIWGWQEKPTLFWNRILLAAARGESVTINRAASYRNPISDFEASDVILKVAEEQMSGKFLAAGKEPISTRTFVEQVQQLPGSKLHVEWKDDGGEDRYLFEPSPELQRWLRPMRERLKEVWGEKPEWVAG